MAAPTEKTLLPSSPMIGTPAGCFSSVSLAEMAAFLAFATLTFFEVDDSCSSVLRFLDGLESSASESLSPSESDSSRAYRYYVSMESRRELAEAKVAYLRSARSFPGSIHFVGTTFRCLMRRERFCELQEDLK